MDGRNRFFATYTMEKILSRSPSVLLDLTFSLTVTGIHILVTPPPGGRDFLSKLKNREEFEGGLEKRKRKGGERRKK